MHPQTLAHLIPATTPGSLAGPGSWHTGKGSSSESLGDVPEVTLAGHCAAGLAPRSLNSELQSFSATEATGAAEAKGRLEQEESALALGSYQAESESRLLQAVGCLRASVTRLTPAQGAGEGHTHAVHMCSAWKVERSMNVTGPTQQKLELLVTKVAHLPGVPNPISPEPGFV